MRTRMLFLVSLFLLCLTVPTLAQLNEDGTEFTFENDLVVVIPDGWTAADQDNDERDFVALDDGRTGLSLLLYYPGTLEDANAETAADALVAHYDSVLGIELDADDIEDVTLEGVDGGRILTTVTTDEDEYEQLAYGFLLPDGYGLLALIYPMSGSGLRSTSEDDALPIIESVLENVGDSSNGSDPEDEGVDIDLPDIGPAGGDDDEQQSGEDSSSTSQDGVHDYGYRTTLTIPEGWKLEDETPASVLMTDGETKIELGFYTPHRAGLKGRDAEDLLMDYFKTVNNADANEVDPDNIEETEIAGLEAVRYETRYSPEEGEEYELTVISVILPNEAGIIAALYPAAGDTLDSEFRALSVIEDFVAAQPEAVDEVDFGYGMIFDVPRGWAVAALTDTFVKLDNGAISLTLKMYYPSVVEAARMESPEDVLSYYMEIAYPDVDFRDRDAESIDLGRLDGARFTYEVEDGDASPRVVIATILEDEKRVLIADIIPVQGDRLVGEEETVSLFEEIANDFDDMPDEFVFMDESVFEIPRDWYYFQSTSDYFISVENDETGMYLVQYSPEEIEGVSTPEEMLEFHDEESIPGSQLEDVEVGGIEGVRYETIFVNSAGNEFDRIEYAFILPNGYSQIVIIYALYEDPIRERDALPLLEDYLEQFN